MKAQVPLQVDTLGRSAACRDGFSCPKNAQSDAKHFTMYSHPCVDGTACSKMQDTQHVALFKHPCQQGAACTKMGPADGSHRDHFEHPCTHNARSCKSIGDRVHLMRFTHICAASVSGCCDTRSSHLDTFQHVCESGTTCAKQSDAVHTRRYLHTLMPLEVKGQCRDADSCADVSDAHRECYLHPCKYGRACKMLLDGRHMSRYQHPCKAGIFCQLQQRDRVHASMFVHYCSDGEQCTRSNDPAHMAATQHPCRYGVNCKILKQGHKKYSPLHAINFIHPCQWADQCAYTQDVKHRSRFTHPCKFGDACTQIDRATHVSRFTHPCLHGTTCKVNTTVHNDFFTHPCSQGLACTNVGVDPSHTHHFTHPWSSQGVTISQTPEAADLLVTMCAAAAQGDVNRFNPFPATVAKGAFINGKAFDGKGVLRALQHIPAVSTIQKLAQATIQSHLDSMDPNAYPLVCWILSSCQASLVKLPANQAIHAMGTPHQYVLMSSPLDQQKKFAQHKTTHGTLWAFHGSAFSNWHCIVRMGLKNYSGTSMQTNGAVYGSGVYLSPDSGVSRSYAPASAAWDNSIHSSSPSCLALCEVIATYSANPHYVVANDSHIMTRFFFVYEKGNTIPSVKATQVQQALPTTTFG